MNERLSNMLHKRILNGENISCQDITFETKPHPNTIKGGWQDIKKLLKLIYATKNSQDLDHLMKGDIPNRAILCINMKILLLKN